MVLGIYGSKPTKHEGGARGRGVFTLPKVTFIDSKQLCMNVLISLVSCSPQLNLVAIPRTLTQLYTALVEGLLLRYIKSVPEFDTLKIISVSSLPDIRKCLVQCIPRYNNYDVCKTIQCAGNLERRIPHICEYWYNRRWWVWA